MLPDQSYIWPSMVNMWVARRQACLSVQEWSGTCELYRALAPEVQHRPVAQSRRCPSVASFSRTARLFASIIPKNNTANDFYKRRCLTRQIDNGYLIAGSCHTLIGGAKEQWPWRPSHGWRHTALHSTLLTQQTPSCTPA